jgi:DNA polymerase elongation subunit (family B)
VCTIDRCLLSKVNAVATEMELLDAFVDAVRALDPDILVGYDVRKVIDDGCCRLMMDDDG